MSTPTIKLEKITPAIAEEYLTANTHNRPLVRSQVEKLKGAILRGEWVATHQGIAFDAQGALIDGQHRLHAILESGQVVSCFVARGIASSAFSVIDTGRTRRVADIFALAGISNSVKNAAITGYVLTLSKGQALTTRTPYSAELLLDHYAKIKDSIERIRAIIGYGSERTPSALVACFVFSDMIFLGTEFHNKLNRFIADFATGEGLAKGDPAYCLRESPLATKHRSDSEIISKRALLAIRKHLNGERLFLFRDNADPLRALTDLAAKARRDAATPHPRREHNKEGKI